MYRSIRAASDNFTPEVIAHGSTKLWTRLFARFFPVSPVTVPHYGLYHRNFAVLGHGLTFNMNAGNRESPPLETPPV
jgi:hypothetical protein